MNISEGTKATKETTERFNKKIESGEKLKKQAKEIDAILKNIDVSGLDTDTVSAMKGAKRGYSKDFSGEVESKVTREVKATAKSAEGNLSALETSKGKAEKGAKGLEKAERVSDIGKSGADSAKNKLESDARDYGKLTEKNRSAIKDAQTKAENLSADVKKLFNN